MIPVRSTALGGVFVVSYDTDHYTYQIYILLYDFSNRHWSSSVEGVIQLRFRCREDVTRKMMLEFIHVDYQDSGTLRHVHLMCLQSVLGTRYMNAYHN